MRTNRKAKAEQEFTEVQNRVYSAVNACSKTLQRLPTRDLPKLTKVGHELIAALLENKDEQDMAEFILRQVIETEIIELEGNA